MNNEESEIFKITNHIPFEKKIEFLDYISLSENSMNSNQKERIKKKVISHINKGLPEKRNPYKSAVIAASIMVCITAAGLSPVGQKVVADITEKLFFIPGEGKAVENNGNEIYILPQQLQYKSDSINVTVNSVTKNNKTIELVMSGTESWQNQKLIIQDDNGNKYTSSMSSIGSGNGWIGNYYFNDIPVDVKSFKILYTDVDILQVNLIKAESFSDYASMGPTDTKNNFGITLVPMKADNKIWFDLIQHSLQDREVFLYGKEDKEGHSHLGISINDEKGAAYNVEYPKNFGTTSKFYFNIKEPTQKFTVSIPEITLKYKVDNVITLPMPKEGEALVNKSITMHGFIFKITKIERKGNKVTLYADNGYDENKRENLSMVYLDMGAMSLGSYSWRFNDNIINEAYEFNINPKDKSLKLKFNEMHTIMKGPWSFEIYGK